MKAYLLFLILQLYHCKSDKIYFIGFCQLQELKSYKNYKNMKNFAQN